MMRRIEWLSLCAVLSSGCGGSETTAYDSAGTSDDPPTEDRSMCAELGAGAKWRRLSAPTSCDIPTAARFHGCAATGEQGIAVSDQYGTHELTTPVALPSAPTECLAAFDDRCRFGEAELAACRSGDAGAACLLARLRPAEMEAAWCGSYVDTRGEAWSLVAGCHDIGSQQGHIPGQVRVTGNAVLEFENAAGTRQTVQVSVDSEAMDMQGCCLC